MHRATGRAAAISVICAAAAAGAESATPPGAPSATGAHDPNAQALAYYPPAALSAGAQGVAEVVCAGRLRRPGDCRIAAEAPIGQGFGEAALRLALATHSTQS